MASTHDFHDYKVAGIERATLEAWAKVVGWEVLLNRAGTTFRKLPDAARQNLDEARRPSSSCSSNRR